MATAATEVQTKFQMIDLGKISESPMNPRKHFDPQSLKELAESIKAHGVQQPIVVRPDGNKQDRFEIVVGARRSRAAKLAGVMKPWDMKHYSGKRPKAFNRRPSRSQPKLANLWVTSMRA
jgi:hypothetical protein